VWTVLVLLLVSSAAEPAAEPTLDKPTLAWMQVVLDRWDAACRGYLHTTVEPLPWIVFYDEHNAWHLNPETGLLPPHQMVTTPLVFAGKPLAVARVAHDGGLWVPGRAALPLKPAAVAMPYANDTKSFCIVPLPALFRKLAPADQAPHRLP
jgi:hypothetical protein